MRSHVRQVLAAIVVGLWAPSAAAQADDETPVGQPTAAPVVAPESPDSELPPEPEQALEPAPEPPAPLVVTPAPAPTPAPAVVAAGVPVELSGQLRLRGESSAELDLDPDADVTDFDGERVFSRIRVRATGKPVEGLKVVVELQDSRRFGGEVSTTTTAPSLGVYQGYFELTDVGGAPVSLIVGRQVMNYGDQRVIGGLDWTNTSRTFDTARAHVVPSDGLWVDAFYVRLHDERLGARAVGDDLAGAYASLVRSAGTFDGYVLYLHDKGGEVDTTGDGVPDQDRFPGGGRLHLVTVGTRYDGDPIAALHVNAELAAQLGDRGDLSIFAWAAQAQAAYTLDGAVAPAVYGGIAYSPGDDDPADDSFGTFENLFPANHLFYGYMDLAAWKNVINPFVGVRAKPTPKLQTSATVHALARATKEDTFYRATGAPLVSPALAGATDGLYVGTEVDLLAKLAASDALQLLGGLSLLLPGSFLDDTAPSGDVGTPYFGYLMATASF
jgi:hypothetical protein